MEFKESQAIYLQIADLICENILTGSWKPGERIPSVRELAETTEVNPNTVMRTFAYLQDQGIIENQRGIGYFVSARAFDITMELKRKGFVQRDLPRVFRTMELLRMSFDDLRALHAASGSEGKEKTI
jgi:GntR family transcriptional regulator